MVTINNVSDREVTFKVECISPEYKEKFIEKFYEFIDKLNKEI